ncbi:MAG: extracellular solute-binding protein [Pseudomonadota bacterium]
MTRILPVAAASFAVASAVSVASSAGATEELNALVWCDHSDPAFLQPFEEANDVKVNVREYEGTGVALALVEQSRPGDWDVFVIDGIDVGRAVDRDLLAPLPRDALPMSDIFPEVRMEEQNGRDGELYAVTEKFGYNTIAFNKTKVDPADMQDAAMPFSEKYAGRIAIYDYYLPVLGMTQIARGGATSDMTEDDVAALEADLLKLKDNATGVLGVVAAQTALATGEVDIVYGGGEWLTAVLSAEQPELDWTIPDAGAVRWTQSIGIFKDSEKQELALKFVQYVLSPEGQARLATSSCFWAMPANEMAGEHLTNEQKAALRWDEQKGYLSNTQLYPAPDEDLDIIMQDLWAEMLQH